MADTEEAPDEETPLVEEDDDGVEAPEENMEDKEEPEAKEGDFSGDKIPENTYFVFVYKEETEIKEKGEMTPMTDALTSKLEDAGMEVEVKKYPVDVDGEETECCFMCVTCDEERLKKEADRIKFNMHLDPEKTKAKAEELNVNVQDSEFVTPWGPYEYLYSGYENDFVEHMVPLFTKPKVTEGGKAEGEDAEGEDEEIFPTRAKTMIALSIAKAAKSVGGAKIMVSELKNKGKLLGCFAPHEECKEIVRNAMCSTCTLPWEYPTDTVREYFGEKVAFYFSFQTYYTTCLIALMVIAGLCLFFANSFKATMHRGTALASLLNSYWNSVYCIFTIFWANWFCQSWKRQESIKATQWGTYGLSGFAPDRPEYKGKQIISYIDGGVMRFKPKNKLWMRRAFSGFITFLFIVALLLCVAAIFYIRRLWVVYYRISFFNWRIVYVNDDFDDDAATDDGAEPIGTTLASIATAINVQIWSALYGLIVVALNKFENHRTDAEYSDAYINKHFAFMFVNSYAALIYICFIQDNIGDPCDDYGVSACIDLAAKQLATLIGTNIIVAQISQVFLPWYGKECCTPPPEEALKCQLQKEFELEEYDTLIGLNEDYLTQIIQYGYVVVFAGALPFSPFIAFVNNFFEPKNDAYTLSVFCYRPVAEFADGIGAWGGILKGMSVLAIISNTALVCFTSTFLEAVPYEMSIHHTFLIFMGTQYILGFAVMILFDTEDDEKVPIQQKRAAFIVPILEDKDQKGPEEGHNFDPKADTEKEGQGCIEQLI